MATTAAPVSHDVKETHSSDSIDRPARANARLSIALSDEQFEKLYLQPPEGSPSANRRQFANPTAFGVSCLAIHLIPIAINLLGWGPSSALSNTVLVGTFFFTGGLGLTLCGILEFVLGNSFTCYVFLSLGGFLASFGALVDPQFAVVSAFPGGAADPAYLGGLSVFLYSWATWFLIGFIASTRTNLCFMLAFLCLTCFFFLYASYFQLIARGKIDTANAVLKAAGAFVLAGAFDVWYLLAAMLFPLVGLPSLPVFDLQGLWRRMPGYRASA